jgi:hypothetical protein
VVLIIVLSGVVDDEEFGRLLGDVARLLIRLLTGLP